MFKHEPMAAGGGEVLYEGAEAGCAGLLLVADGGGVGQADDDPEADDGVEDLPSPVVAFLGEVQPCLPGQAQPSQDGRGRCKVAGLYDRGSDEQAVPLALVDEDVRAHPGVV